MSEKTPSEGNGNEEGGERRWGEGLPSPRRAQDIEFVPLYINRPHRHFGKG